MTTAPALRPCPFCGGHNLQGHPIHLRVECIDCYAEGPEANSRAEAIAAWNARPGGDEAVRLGALVKDLSDTLLRLRPLGGSECFRQFGDAYYADPIYFCGVIEKQRNELRETKMNLASAQKELAAIRARAQMERGK